MTKLKEIMMERMTWNEIQEALEEGFTTAVIMTGSIEQHGPHLPLSTDMLLGYAVGERVARRLGNALLAPVIRPGISEHHMAFAGTVSISPETFKALVNDYAHSLARHGFRRLAIAWSHGGNAAAIRALAPRLAAELPEVELLIETNLPKMIQTMYPVASAAGIDLESFGIHAGEMEASMILAHAPAQVRKDRLAQGFMGDLVSEASEHTKLLQEGLHKLTDNGILGDARPADAARGEAYLEAMAAYIVDNLVQV